jgi:WD40 repeat protein
MLTQRGGAGQGMALRRRGERRCGAGLAAALGAVLLFSASGWTSNAAAVTPMFSPVSGSPFATTGSPPSYGDGPVSLAFSPDGAVLTTGNTDGSVSEFSVASSGALTQLSGALTGEDESASSLVWNSSGTVLAVASDDATGGPVIQTFARDSDTNQLTAVATTDTSLPVTALEFNNGFLLATMTAGDSATGLIASYAAGADGSLASSPVSEVNAGIFPVALAGLTVAAEGSDALIEYSLDAGGVLSRFRSVHIAASPDALAGGGRQLAVGLSGADEALLIPDHTRTGWLLPRDAKTLPLPSPATSLAWGSDGTLLAVSTGSAGQDVVFRETTSVDNPPIDVKPVAGSPFTVGDDPSSVQFSPSGEFLATANEADSTVTMLAAADPQCFSSTAGVQAGQVSFIPLRCHHVAGADVSYTLVSAPTHGRFLGFYPARRAARYRADRHYHGLDSFTYRVSNNLGESAVVTVTIQFR